jgi:accessory gene regulator protein AgrB
MEGLQALCVEDQQILLLHLIFYTTSKKTFGIHSIGYWVCILLSIYGFRGFLGMMFLPSNINLALCTVCTSTLLCVPYEPLKKCNS